MAQDSLGDRIDRFLAAVERGRWDEASALLGPDVNVNSVDGEDRCALAIAIRKAPDLVAPLLAAGADPNGPPGTMARGVPLCAAAEAHAVDLCRRLLAAGADPNIVPDELSALDAACARHTTDADALLEVVRLLLNAGANPNKPTPYCGLALARNAHSPLAAMALLVSHGLDLTYNEEHLLGAATRHSLAMLELVLLAGARVHALTLNSLLLNAVDMGFAFRTTGPRNEELGGVVRTLVSLGASVRARDILGYTPLHFAACRAYAVIDALVECGADLEARDERGNTPLHLAAKKEWWERVTELILAGADAGARNRDGCTPAEMGDAQGWREALPRKVKLA